MEMEKGYREDVFFSGVSASGIEYRVIKLISVGFETLYHIERNSKENPTTFEMVGKIYTNATNVLKAAKRMVENDHAGVYESV